MTQQEMRQRTKRFALEIVKLEAQIPDTRSGRTIANQIIRSGTSVGANYRAVCRAKSDRDFLNKIIIVEEEADETMFWLELLEESGMMSEVVIRPIWKEASELTAMFTASGKTVREKLERK